MWHGPSPADVLHGVVEHGTYHGGQTALLRRALGSAAPPVSRPAAFDFALARRAAQVRAPDPGGIVAAGQARARSAA